VEQLTFVKVTETLKMLLGQMKAVKLEEKETLATEVSGSYYAMGNRSTHAGGDTFKRNVGQHNVL
jgi:nitrite reductase/ring-hydroxylating ferredoxin subunit